MSTRWVTRSARSRDGSPACRRTASAGAPGGSAASADGRTATRPGTRGWVSSTARSSQVSRATILPCSTAIPLLTLSDCAPQTPCAVVRISPRSVSTTTPELSSTSPPMRAVTATTLRSSRSAGAGACWAVAARAAAGHHDEHRRGGRPVASALVRGPCTHFRRTSSSFPALWPMLIRTRGAPGTAGQIPYLRPRSIRGAVSVGPRESMKVRKPAPGVLAPVLVCLVLGALGGVGTALVTKPEARAQAARFTLPRQPAPHFWLRDESGTVRTPASARGEVLVVTFIYTRCRDLCPRQAAEIKDAVLRAGGGVEVYAITVDPEHDTPERARAWLKRMGVAGGPVHILLGSRRELAPVWAAVRDRADRERPASRGAGGERGGARGVRGVRARVRGARRRGGAPRDARVPRPRPRPPTRTTRRSRTAPTAGSRATPAGWTTSTARTRC